MILLALWFSSTVLVICSAAHWLPIQVTVSTFPLIATACLICATQLYNDPCLRVPFWATPTRLRSLSEVEDPPPVPEKSYTVEALLTTFCFWATVFWCIGYTVAAGISSGLAALLVLGLISRSISTSSPSPSPSSSSSSSTITNRAISDSASGTDV